MITNANWRHCSCLLSALGWTVWFVTNRMQGGFLHLQAHRAAQAHLPGFELGGICIHALAMTLQGVAQLI